MKKVTLFLVFVCLNLISYAQTDSTKIKQSEKKEYEIKTLLNKEHRHGGYGAIMMNYTEINGSPNLLMGFRGGWVMNHYFALGIGGYGLTTDNSLSLLDDNNAQVEMGYGGIYLEPIIASRQAIHVTFPILIGAGGSAITSARFDNWNDEWNESDVYDADAFLIIEPGMNLELNLTKHFRIDLGASYRHVEGFDINSIDSDLLNGWATNITFKFGKF